jgi:hypothetical protein
VKRKEAKEGKVNSYLMSDKRSNKYNSGTNSSLLSVPIVQIGQKPVIFFEEPGCTITTEKNSLCAE